MCDLVGTEADTMGCPHECGWRGPAPGLYGVSGDRIGAGTDGVTKHGARPTGATLHVERVARPLSDVAGNIQNLLVIERDDAVAIVPLAEWWERTADASSHRTRRHDMVADDPP
jgi:hypothetical protein